MWFILIFCYFLSAVPSYLLRRKLSIELPKYGAQINNIFFGILAILGLIVGLSLGGSFDIGLKNYILIFFISIIWPIYQRLSYISTQKIEAGIFSIIQNSQIIYSIFFSMMIVSETVNSIELLGMFLLFISAIIAKFTVSKSPKKINVYLLIAFLVPIIYAFGTTLEKLTINQSNYASYIMVGFLAQFIASVLLQKNKIEDIKFLFKSKYKIQIFLYGLLSALKGLFVVAAFATGKIALTNAAASFTGPLTLIAAYFYLNEKDHMRKKIIATVIGLAGLLILKLN